MCTVIHICGVNAYFSIVRVGSTIFLIYFIQSLSFPISPSSDVISHIQVPGKEELNFEHWIFEVYNAESHYKESVMQEAVIHSLKGSASNLVHFLGPHATVKAIL